MVAHALRFPSLHWARLRAYSDGSANVFCIDGSTYQFPNEEEARHFLAEDEYSAPGDLDEKDEVELGVPLASIIPPAGDTDERLLPQMYVKVE